MSETIFAKIIRREIPVEVLFEDDECLAFRDNNPQAPIHFLVIPKRQIKSIAQLEPNDSELAGHLLSVCQTVAKQEGLANGYRIVTNIGIDGGQSVEHLHFHVLGGRSLRWPPG